MKTTLIGSPTETEAALLGLQSKEGRTSAGEINAAT